MTEFQFKPSQADAQHIEKYLALFANCFPDSDLFTADYLTWLYAENPQGDVIGVDAWDGEALAATYVCIPTVLKIKGQMRRALLSLNTATHSDYRGQGLFTRLASKTYDLGLEKGYEIVYGVANANSIGGFIRKLGFIDVGGLNARVGLGYARAKASDETLTDLDFQRVWTEADLNWRVKNPSSPLTAKSGRNGVKIFGKTHVPFVGSAAFLPKAFIEGSTDSLPSQGASYPLNVTLALVPGAEFKGLNMELPQKFRPSPLRLIFRDLTDETAKISAGKTFISFIDFDAF